MKRILFMLLLFVCFIPIWGQTYFSYCKLINGYWGQWENSNPYRFIDGGYLLQGTYDEFIIYENGKHPSQYIMKVKLFAMRIEEDKKIKKKRIKSGEWYQYTGSVEYYTKDVLERFNDIIQQWPYTSDTSNGKRHTVAATIKIQPYKKKPEVYNIFFENLGIGIQLSQ